MSSQPTLTDPTPEEPDQFRSRLLDDTLFWFGLTTFPGLLFSLSRVFVIGWHPIMAVHVVLFALLWSVWLGRRRLAYRLRAGSLLGLLWLAGMTGMALLGPAAAGQVFIIFFSFSAVLFFPLRAALYLVTVNIASLMLLGVVASLGGLHFQLDYGVYAYHPLTWAHIVWNLGSYGVVLAYIGWRMVTGLREQAIAALAASERIEKIGANVPGVIYQFRLDADGRVSFPYVSEGARTLFGVDPASLREDARQAFAMVYPDDRERLMETIRVSARDLTPIREVVRYIQPGKGLLWMERHSSPERLANGDTLWHGFMLEVTELKAAEQRLAATLENTPNVAVQWYDSDGHVLYWNPASERLFGWNAEEAMGQSADRLILSETDGREFRAAIARIGASGTTFGPAELLARHRDGSPRQLSATLFPIQGRGEPRFVLMAVDISARKRSEETLRRYQFIVNTVADMMTLVSRDHCYEAVNDRWCQLMQRPRESVEGRPLAEVWGEPVYREHIEPRLRECFETGRPLILEATVELPDLGARECEISYFPYEKLPGRITHVVVVTRDVTEKAVAERQTLAAKEAAEEASRAKSAFLASMSHELRTPLNAIIGFAQILEQDDSPALADQHREAVGHIAAGGRHLLKLIDEVLDLARIEAGRLEVDLRAVELDGLVADTLALTRPLADERQIVIGQACSLGARVLADEARLRQVLLNLLSNAVKYNRPGGLVTVSCRLLGERLRVTVIDTGPGIPEARQGGLFQSFQRLGAERTATEGTGIGLAISKKLVEAMGGAIGFDSQVGVGSRFWVELPVVGSDRPGASVPVPEDGFRRELGVRGRVLYVEDNAFNQAVMRHTFRLLPRVELQIEDTAEAALESIRNLPPDLVLMDINLPGMSGLDALRLLKADPATCDIPVIAVSAAAMPEEREAGLQAGFLSYLTKPVDVSALLGRVSALLGGDS